MTRLMRTLSVGAAVAALAAPTAGAAEKFIPGVTDFPSADRAEKYVPGVTDFPSTGYRPVEEASPVAGRTPADDGGFEWVAALIGGSAGMALGVLLLGTGQALRRRAKLA